MDNNLSRYASHQVLLVNRIREAADAMQHCDFQFATQSLISSLRLSQTALSHLHYQSHQNRTRRAREAAGDEELQPPPPPETVQRAPSGITLERCPLGLTTSVSSVWFVYKDARRIGSLPQHVLDLLNEDGAAELGENDDNNNSESTEETEQILLSCYHVITSVLTYNIAALYHIKAFGPSTTDYTSRETQLEQRRSNMERAHVLYTKAIDLYQTCSVEDRIHDISRILGVWNNLAHINQCMENVGRVQHCCDQLLRLLSSQSSTSAARLVFPADPTIATTVQNEEAAVIVEEVHVQVEDGVEQAETTADDGHTAGNNNNDDDTRSDDDEDVGATAPITTSSANDEPVEGTNESNEGDHLDHDDDEATTTNTTTNENITTALLAGSAMQDILMQQDWQLFSDHVSFLLGVECGKLAAAA